MAALRPESRAPYDNLTMAVVTLNKPFNKENTIQLQGRLLAHSFGIAAASALRLYGVILVSLFIEMYKISRLHAIAQYRISC